MLILLTDGLRYPTRRPSLMASTLSHTVYRTQQRLLLQFLSAPEDGHKKRPKHVEQYCSSK